jgi:hypothetical protein
MRLKNLATRRRDDQRLREEMEEHLALQTAENLRAGMTPSEARREAILKFGAVGTIREEYHSEVSLPFIETLLQDLRGSHAFEISRILFHRDRHHGAGCRSYHRDL